MINSCSCCLFCQVREVGHVPHALEAPSVVEAAPSHALIAVKEAQQLS